MKPATSIRSRRTRTRTGQKSGYYLTNYLYILPILTFVALFVYYGIGYTASISFYDWNGISPQRTYVGVDNYVSVLRDPIFFQALLNTFIFMAITIGAQMALGLTMAILLQANVRFKVVYKVIFFLPVIVSTAVIAYVFRQILSGTNGDLNLFLTSIGLESLTHAWLADPKLALFALALINIWQWTGFSFLLYSAALTVIDEEVFDAAKIDGANFLQRILYLLIPMLRSTHFSLIILGVIGTLKTFDLVYLTTGGGPGRSTEFLSTYIFKRGILDFDAGYSAALSIVLLCVALVITAFQLRVYARQPER